MRFSRRHYTAVFLTGLMLAFTCVPGLAADKAAVREAPIVHDRAIVVFRSATLPADAAARVQAAGGRVLSSFHEVGVLVAAPATVEGARLIQNLRRDSAILDADYDRMFDLITPTVAPEGGVSDETHFGSSLTFVGIPFPPDWFYTSTLQQWSVKRVGGQGGGIPGGGAGAWDTTLGAGVKIAILDTGVNPLHLDIAPNLVGAVTFTSHSPAFGEPNCEVPADALLNDLAVDQNGHGTWTASLAAGAAGAGSALLIGTAPQAQILSVKVLRNIADQTPGLSPFNKCRFRNGSGFFSWILGGMLYAQSQGADVISMSLGGFVPRRAPGGGAVLAAFNRIANFINAAGTVIVASAGNAGLDLDNLGSFVHLPSDAEGVISVTATTNPACVEDLTPPLVCAAGPDGLAFYSNFGSSLHGLAAPGGSLPAGGAPGPTGFVRGGCSGGLAGTVTPPSAGYPAVGPPPAGTSWGCFSFTGLSQHAWYVQAVGTSASSPHVAGVAALIKAANPSLTPAQIRTILQQTADDIGKNGYDQFFNFGLANATAGVAAAP